MLKSDRQRANSTRLRVYGKPSDELKALLDGFGATYLRPFGDFTYWPWFGMSTIAAVNVRRPPAYEAFLNAAIKLWNEW